MPTLPDPLHPAIVHFPIAFILLGTVCALVAMLLRKWHLPLFTAILFSAGAIGAVLAQQTGERAHHDLQQSDAAHRLLAEHEEWAERTLVAAGCVAMLAIGAVATTRWAYVARALAVLTGIAALAASACVFATGHYGGRLVYQQGLGVAIATPSTQSSYAAADPVVPARRHHDDD